MKCEARILRENKVKKHWSVWPETNYGPVSPDNVIEGHRFGDLPVCGGDVDAKVEAVDEPYWGGCSAQLQVTLTCSRCQSPYIPGIFELTGDPAAALSRLVTEQWAPAGVKRG